MEKDKTEEKEVIKIVGTIVQIMLYYKQSKMLLEMVLMFWRHHTRMNYLMA